jgi:hypothetical protein
MKKIWFIICFLVLTSSAFGQQFLWSTVQDNKAERYVPLNNVTREVLVFYDQYRHYYDFSGFTKDRFIEMFNYGFDDWQWLYEIKTLTVFALRSNIGHGSVVFIVCVSKNNVNTLIFTNNFELEFRQMPMGTGQYNKQKFSDWFRTILN